ncbi:MAG: ABC transporter substrate-binding protein [Planctomycetota bacterium]
MRVGKAAILICVVVLVGLPLVLAPRRTSPAGADRLIIVTPHNEQIRYEFGRAFETWHAERFGRQVHVVWSVPGGTSEILRMLRSQYAAAAEAGDPLGGTADLFFGGGTWIHEQLTKPPVEISAPVDFDDRWLTAVYGENLIGDARLYDPQKRWFGTAVSAFGIVYNRDALAEAGVPEPRLWQDLADPRLVGWVALADPAHSGSITTLFEAILRRRGWAEGWRILRRAGANARSFTTSAIKAPGEVSLGDAAAGLCIDFFGRYEEQAVRVAGDPDRLGYIDPAGETSIDPDPISLLIGAPRPDLARRFIEFCLTENGQALWQFAVGDTIGDGLGPHRYELRRMPILRSMYARHFDRFVDRVDPYALATAAHDTRPGVRDNIDVLMGAIAVDHHDRLRAAWEAVFNHPAYPQRPGIVTAEDTEDPGLARMLELFDAMPEGWQTGPLWPPPPGPRTETRRRFAEFYRDNYERIIELGEQSRRERVESSK